MDSERMIMVPDWLVEEAASLIEQAGLSGTGVSLVAPRLRAALAQPAAGEPKQQTAINADDLPTKKYPLGAFDFDSPDDAPVAAGEPVAYAAFADNGNIQMWCKDGIDVARVLASTGKKPVPLYTAPPAAAHGDEAVRFERADVIAVLREDLLVMSGDVDPSTGRSEMEFRLASWLKGHDIPVFRKTLYAMRAQGDGE